MTTTYPAWLARELYPCPQCFMEVAGCRVHYVDVGHGPAVVMLHGDPTWSFLYRHLIQALSPDYRCIAPDYPGFGLSPAGPGYRGTPAEHAMVMARLLQALKVQGGTLVAHDWGGPIGLATALAQPQLFRRFVVSNSWAWPLGEWRFQLFARGMGSLLGRGAVRYGNVLVRGLLPLATRSSWPASVKAAYRGPFRARSRRGSMIALAQALVADNDFLRQVAAGLCRLADNPLLLVWGVQDPAFGARHRRGFEERFRHHETHVLGDAGHYVWEDTPGSACTLVREWLTASPYLLDGLSPSGVPLASVSCA